MSQGLPLRRQKRRWRGLDVDSLDVTFLGSTLRNKILCAVRTDLTTSGFLFGEKDIFWAQGADNA